MPNLSACYFCGTALDEPLSEYPVVPMTLKPAPEDQKTVVLCSVCRRKLGKVLDAVLDSIEDRPIEATVQQDLGDASEVASTDDDGVNAGDATDDSGNGDSQDADAWVSGEEISDDGEATDVGEAGEETIGDDEATDVGEATDDGIVDDGETVDGGTDDATDVDAEPIEDPPTAADGNGEDDDGPHLTALEYTKVMRLLENRDLPVDRDEFRIVATNAYEITPEEFDLVVDAAIDRGLIVEENGQFVDVE